MEKEVAIEAEYKHEMIQNVEKYLEEVLPDYVRRVVVVIKVIELK